MQAEHSTDDHLPSPDPNEEELKTTRAVCQSHSTRSVLRDVSAGLRGPSSQPSLQLPGEGGISEISYWRPRDKQNGKDRIATLSLKGAYKYLGHTVGIGMPGGHLIRPAVREAGWLEPEKGE